MKMSCSCTLTRDDSYANSFSENFNFDNPVRIQVLTVPSGLFNLIAMSLWLRSSQNEYSMALRCPSSSCDNDRTTAARCSLRDGSPSGIADEAGCGAAALAGSGSVVGN